MRHNGIDTRAKLAFRLEPRGISRMTVYRLFTEDWQGEATVPMIAALAKEFRVALTQLVIEPFDPAKEPA